MNRLLLFAGLVGWIGVSLVLMELRWFRRTNLSARLQPYAPVAVGPRRPVPTASSPAQAALGALEPLARDMGDRLSGLLGVQEELGLRLQRVHSPMSPSSFRMRQLGWSLIALVAGGALTLLAQPPAVIGLLFLLGAPLLAFLVLEQQLASASKRWQHEVFLELPVIAEQLGMLLSAGFSLGAALNRLSRRGQGACRRDIQRACARLRQGVPEADALREWADIVQLSQLSRLVNVLALNREASDLGRLISEEARAIRRDVQRELIERIERRAQQVWIPVTVATLVPGVLFLAVPFIEAMRLFTAT